MTSSGRSIFDVVTNPPANWHGSGAVWLWDTGRRRLAWANGEALALWEAKDFAQAEARMDVAQQPGLANLARLSGTLPENGGRIERLRLFIGGSNANLTCQCAWHPCGRGRLLAVRVLDAGARRSGGRGGHRAADSAGGDLAAGMLAGLGEPALAIGKGGDLLYANPPGASLFFNVAPDGTHRHAIRGLDALARRAGETGRCEGRLRCGDMVVNVEAVEVRPADGGQGFVAVRGLGAAVAESAPARPDDGAPGARIEAAISSAAAAEQGEKSGEGRPHPELPLGPGTAAGRESAAGQPAREAPGPQEGSGDLAWQARSAPEAEFGADDGDATDVIFKTDWDGPGESAGLRTGGQRGRHGEVVPFRGGGRATERINPLDPHEHDAFRALAKALGARIEGDEADDGGTPAQQDLAPEGSKFLPPVGNDPEDAGRGGKKAAGISPPLSAQPAIKRDDLAELLVRLPVGVLIYRDGEPLFANRAFLDLFGFADIGELAARGDVTRLLPRSGEPQSRSGGETGRSGALTAYDRHGRPVPVMARLQAVNWGESTAMALSVQPAGEAVSPAPGAREEEWAKIAGLATSGLAILSQQGAITSLSAAAQSLLGRSSEDCAGAPFETLFCPASREVVRDYLDGLRTHGVASILGDGRSVAAAVPGAADLPLFVTLGILGDDPERRFCAIFRDISASARKEAELVKARDLAEETSRQKSEFITRMSHEMRTPLNSIIGFAEVIMGEHIGNIGSERYRDYIRDIHASGRHLLGLVNDLLDLSKVEAGKMELDFASVDINEIAVQAIRLMLPEANRGRVVLRSSLARKLPAVVADARSLKQILLNLLSNAVKFTLPGGQVALATVLTPAGEVQIRVRDTGIGMEEQDLALAMEPYGQAARTAKLPRTPGTGLGLPLTKALAEANRARFHIESEDGRGTLTEITFPSQRVLDE